MQYDMEVCSCVREKRRIQYKNTKGSINDEKKRSRSFPKAIIYMMDLSRLEHSKVVDDTAVYLQSRRVETICRRLIEDLQNITTLFTEWKIKINIKNTVAVSFVKRGEYLGMILDRKLTYRQPIKKTKRRAKYLMSKLYQLLNRKSSLTVENKLKTSTFLYGSEIWTTATASQQKFLDKTLQTREVPDSVQPSFLSHGQAYSYLRWSTIAYFAWSWQTKHEWEE